VNPFRSYAFASYPFRSNPLAGGGVIPVGDILTFDVTILMMLIVHAYCQMTGAFDVTALMLLLIYADIRGDIDSPASTAMCMNFNVEQLED
jgi:hypothetical protein